MGKRNIYNNTQMTIEGFGKILSEEVKILLGSDYEVDYHEVLKNNGVTFHALIIRHKNRNVAPTIYFDSFFEAYKCGGLLVDIAKEIVEIYNRYMPSEDQSMDFFEDFSKVSGSLFFKLVNLKKNKKKLEGVPYRKIMDMAMVPLCRVKSDLLGEGVITIHDNYLKQWEISEDELWENIGENAAKTAPPKISGLMDIIENATGYETECDAFSGVCVVSNESGHLGAGAVFYPGLLKGLSEDFESDLYIIPSSIHECIVIPDPGFVMDPANLREIIHEVNTTTVSEEDVLSDNLYRYEYESDKVFMVKDA